MHAQRQLGPTDTERWLTTLQAGYRVGATGHIPIVSRAVAAALGFVLTTARAADHGQISVSSARAAIIRTANAAAANADTLAGNVTAAHRTGAIAIDTYRAAWAAATADELRAIARALETHFAADL